MSTGFGVGLLDRLEVVLAEAVEGVAALDDHTGRRHVADADRVVLRGLRRLGEVEPDLLGVDVERGDELDVVDVVVTEHDVHQTGDVARRVGVLVVLDALDQGRRAVADAHDCYSYRTHVGLFLPSGCFRRSRRPRGPRCGGVAQVAGLVATGSDAGSVTCWLVGCSDGALGVDEVGQPGDLALDGLDGVPAELGEVAVVAATAGVLGPVEPLLQPGQPSLRGCAVVRRRRCARRTRTGWRTCRPPTQPDRCR